MKHTLTRLLKGNKKKGFTLFVALVVSSLLLSISISLSNIILKQLIFSNTGSESQLAFYAADSGAECALYWDRKGPDGSTLFDGSFATSTIDTSVQGPLDILCGMGDSTNDPRVGSIQKIVAPLPNQNAATTTFYVNYTDTNAALSNLACSKVVVAKWYDYSTGYPVEKTRIDSRGYNAPFTGSVGVTATPYDEKTGNNPGYGHCDTSGPRVVERAVRLEY
jgi:hypothetical protein